MRRRAPGRPDGRSATKQNTCKACYISTRANTEKNLKEFLEDNAAILQKLLPWKN